MKLTEQKVEHLDCFEMVFPETNSPDFVKCAAEEWRNLQNEDLDAANSYAAQLYSLLKPKRGGLWINTIFCLWLYLCIERPWERNWFLRFTKKDGFVWKDFWDKMDEITHKVPRYFPSYPDIRSLKKYTNKEDFKLIIGFLATDPRLWSFFGRAIARRVKPITKVKFSIDNQTLEKMRMIGQFVMILKNEGCITKRDLMRKMRIDRKKCDELLERAEKESFVKLFKCPNNRVFIVYKGRHKG